MVKHQAAKKASIGFDEGGDGRRCFHDTLACSFLVKTKIRIKWKGW